MKESATSIRVFCATVTAIATLTERYELAGGQVFANTESTWEIWQLSPRRRIKTISRKKVRWVFENESFDDFFRHCHPPQKKVFVLSRLPRTKQARRNTK